MLRCFGNKVIIYKATPLFFLSPVPCPNECRLTDTSQLNDLNQQRALQQLKVTAAQTTTDSARAHYQRGLLSRYAAEEARRAVLAQQLLLLDIEAQRLSTDITLIKALGGGYRGQ